MTALDIRALETTRPVRWLHPLPASRPRRREDVLVSLSRGKRVIHIGFVDEPLLESRIADGSWLHARLAQVTSSLVGLDIATDGVAWARRAGFDAYTIDAQSPDEVAALDLPPADVVLAGEVIEHLDAPGPFLRAMRTLVADDGVLVLTTPNAYRPLNTLVAFLRRELIHEDHTAWHSHRTLRVLLERNGWRVETEGWYHDPPAPADSEDALSRRLQVVAANGLRRTVGALGRVAPGWSDGLLVVARLAEVSR